MAGVFKFACVVLAFMVVAAPYAAEGALTCGQVDGKMAPCLGYLMGRPIASNCCQNVVALLGMAKSTPDRQAACNCLKNAAKSMTGIKMANAAALPRLCKVNIPYSISPNTDCANNVAVGVAVEFSISSCNQIESDQIRSDHGYVTSC
ncbi:hypothetical protein MKX01_039846 [Papaver californicum]|nr:hypothetical protein MKX01_039846 [Papaver californicum]